ncbi:uncharacterized protein LOC114530255 [Dendronephthya gigantea]|uniref:uncharacterized protein LOC114530255 n=1 Tax=Dendronephthya gigantea TaxID=151771 RepID=UPI00106C3839|nr:uncharacterized protein LOC114530255 [Dendronephthya gigantea]XP_028407662.1 uncharacterized protein LOC114530255 [Dendronephthya gigantea]
MTTVGYYEELRSMSSPNSEIPSFGSRDFRVIRYFLRVLSVWRPQSAGFVESYVYPVAVNLLLLTAGILRNVVQAVGKPTWLSIQLLYLVHEIVVWLGHILANRYFASRDMEMNVLNPIKPLVGIQKPLKRKLKILNAVVIISMTFVTVMLSTLYVVVGLLWYKGAQRFSAALPHLHGPADHVLYGLVLVTIIYDLGIALALFWTLSLLYCCYAARLKALEGIFLRWKQTSVDAVSFFMQLYARPVKNSWKQMSWWFIAHNIVALAIPLYGYELAQAISGREYHSKHLPQFICYLIFIVTIWLAPIFVSEQIKRREKKFLERINNISPWSLEAENNNPGGYLPDERGVHTLNGESGVRCIVLNSENDIPRSRCTCQRASLGLSSTGSNSSENPERVSRSAVFTFAFRGEELRNFLRFLKGRTPGLVSRGYSFQLNLSFISLIGGAISFLTELHSVNSENMLYKHCNGTVS